VWSKQKQGAQGSDYNEIFLAVLNMVESKTSAMIHQKKRPSFYFEGC